MASNLVAIGLPPETDHCKALGEPLAHKSLEHRTRCIIWAPSPSIASRRAEALEFRVALERTGELGGERQGTMRPRDHEARISWNVRIHTVLHQVNGDTPHSTCVGKDALNALVAEMRGASEEQHMEERQSLGLD